MVRAILSGIWTPAEAGVPEAPLSQVPALGGVVGLDSVDRVLPELIARSSAARSPMSLVLVRPGKAGSTEPPSPGGIADLAAALTVSLAPDQQLLQAGPGHLAVVVTGGTGTARRHVQRLMARAALVGAPVLTWAMASCPRDGSSSAALIQTATGRLVLPAGNNPAGTAAGHGRGALWAGAAAAVLVGAFAYTFGSGHGAKNPSPSAAVAQSGQSGVSAAAVGGSPPASGGSGGGQQVAGQGSVPPSWIGGAQSGTSGSSTAGVGGSADAGTPAGTGGTSTVTPPGNGGGQQQSTGTNTGGSIPSIPTTTISGITTTTVAGSGTGGTTGGTTSGGTTGTGTTGSTSSGTTGGTNNQCTGLLQSLLCTVNGLLG